MCCFVLLFVAFFENLNTTQNSIGYGIIQRPFARSWSQSSLHYFASIALLCFYQAVATSEYVKDLECRLPTNCFRHTNAEHGIHFREPQYTTNSMTSPDFILASFDVASVSRRNVVAQHTASKSRAQISFSVWPICSRSKKLLAMCTYL